MVQPEMNPGPIMSIAEATKLCGPIQAEVFQTTLRQAIGEAEQLCVHRKLAVADGQWAPECP